MPLISTIARGLAIIATLLPAVRAGFDPLSSNNVVVYWGQNSYGVGTGPLTQQRLSYYCRDSKMDIIPLAFLTNMANPDSLQFANRSPSELENDIQECQKVYGKTIVLSLGGEITHGSGFASNIEAIQKAQQLWAAFGPPGVPGANRKFGNAVVDGFDFDNEKPLSNLIYFARELRRQMSESTKKTGKKYLLTAAPQCPFPDLNVGPVLSSDVAFDAVFIQFYNNPFCSAKAFVSGIEKQLGFNFETWQNWAKQSRNPDVKLMVGVPAAPGAAGSGFISGEKLVEVLAYCKRFSNFGGVMFWDMSQAWSAPDVLIKARAALGGSRPAAPAVQQSPIASPPKTTSNAVTQPAVTPTPKFNPPVAVAPSPVVPPIVSPVKPMPPKAPTTLITKTNDSKPSTTAKVIEAVESAKTQALPSPSPGQLIEVEIVWGGNEPGGFVHEWNQCDGKDWHGGHTCEPNLFCERLSEWYSHCVSAAFRGH
ncbi:Chitinase 1 [Cadophora gregata]|uniref:Chitinase 1 n=1 Tax=Cadophora gregata TaxID=51156 RepID=UPI0026DBA538|nr:Chitinase 1 [Cadophora gregata]KAK0113475.1 Chitinase 1 [Cadophora gregata f. sp. sojae]KAK0114233.1 Chitinase 1 [Cadophora gregata]